MQTYKLQYVSDIHLEKGVRKFSSIVEHIAEDLALVGDIGDPFSKVYAEFLDWCSRKWRRVFVIAGNHEYFLSRSWGGKPKSICEVDAQICKVAEGCAGEVIFLQKEAYVNEDDKIIVLGATLWSVADIRHWDKMFDGFIGQVGTRGEYNAVFKQDEYTGAWRPLHPSDINKVHSEHKEFIRRYVNPTWGSVPEGWRVIVLTHYLPTFSLNDDKHKDNPLRCSYATEMSELFKEPIVAWICGHSHQAKSLRYDSGTLVTLNPMGYVHETGENGFSRRAYVSVHYENIAMSH